MTAYTHHIYHRHKLYCKVHVFHGKRDQQDPCALLHTPSKHPPTSVTQASLKGTQ